MKHEINSEGLQEVINNLEASNTFATLGDLWLAITKAYGEKFPPVKQYLLQQHVKQYKWELKTKPAPKGQARKKSHQIDESHFRRLKKETPKAYHGLVDQIAKGSRAAAMKLQCLECVQYVKAEITNCTCLQCPMFSFRPYSKK